MRGACKLHMSQYVSSAHGNFPVARFYGSLETVYDLRAGAIPIDQRATGAGKSIVKADGTVS